MRSVIYGTILAHLFSLPGPKTHGELILWFSSRPSSIHASTFSKTFSETAWPVKTKFYMKHLKEGGTNVCMNNLGHMTKMGAMPIYGKNP